MKTEDDIDRHLRNWDYEIKEQDRFLPIANVTRIMKKALPERAKLSKEAKECVQECASEFISFITSQAVDKCGLEKRKTLNGEDILWAMFTLGFEHYGETLKIYLAKYRQFEQIEQEKKKGLRRRSRRTEIEYDSGSESELLSGDNFDFGTPEEYVEFDELDLEDELLEQQHSSSQVIA